MKYSSTPIRVCHEFLGRQTTSFNDFSIEAGILLRGNGIPGHVQGLIQVNWQAYAKAVRSGARAGQHHRCKGEAKLDFARTSIHTEMIIMIYDMAGV